MSRSRSRSRDRRRRPSSASPRSRRRRQNHSTTPSPPPRSKMRSDDIEPKKRPAVTRISSVHSKKRPSLTPEMEELQRRVKRDLFTDDAGAERKFLASGSLTRSEKGYIFQGKEFDDVSNKELRKIQIDIRRNIPAHRVSDSPIRRRIADPADVVTPRGKTEGVKPVFDRPDVLLWLPDITEEKTLQMLNDAGEEEREERGVRRRKSASPPAAAGRMRSERRRASRSRSPIGGIKSRLGASSNGGGGDVRSRLGGGNRDRDRENRTDRGGNNGSVKDRLGDRDRDRDRVLDRQELESQRPMVKLWDVNPEYVPRGRAYFEHDSREDQNDDGGDRFYRGGRGGGNMRGRFSRGGFRGETRRGFGRGFNDRNNDRYGNNDRFGGGGDRFRNNDRAGGFQRRGGFNSRRGRSPSPEWKHDKFNEVNQDEPMTT